MIRKLKHSDFGAGVLFVGTGVFGLVLSAKLAVGSASRMGPGYMPRIFAGMVLAFGLILVVRSLFGEADELPRFKARPLLAILGAIGVFGVSIERLGLVVAVFLMVLVASLGSPEMTRRNLWIAALLLTAMTYLVFVRLLDLTIPIWPKF